MSIINKTIIYTYKITEKDQGRLDLLLSSSWNLSRSFIQQLLKKNLISSSEKLCSKKLPSLGSVLSYEEKKFILTPVKPLHFQVVYEDDYFILVNKKPGISVHPGNGYKERTLIEELISCYPFLQEIDESLRPGLVHRLDEGTSGLLMIAKNREAKEKFSLLFQNREIIKMYHALIQGSLLKKEQKIQTLFHRHPHHPLKKTSLTLKGKEAISIVRIKEVFKEASLLEIELHTGRTHQIRVHLAEQLKKPVLGDPLYGGNLYLKELLDEYPFALLHAYSLKFKHPFTDEELFFTAAYPWKFSVMLDSLR